MFQYLKGVPVRTFFLFSNLIYIIMKKKKKIHISIDKKILEKIEKLTTSKSRLIESILLEYLIKSGIKIDDIIL